MKTPLILCLLFICSYPNLCGQSYALVRSGEQRFYDTGLGHVSLEVAESSFDGDSLFTLATHWVHQDGDLSGCAYPDTSSWLGVQVRQAVNGTRILYTMTGAAITLYPSVDLDVSWVAYFSPDASWYLEASLVGFDQFEVLGNVEWVSTIQFQAYNDADGTPIDHWMNDEVVSIAQNSGLLEAPALANFPSPPPFSLPTHFSLSGMEGVAGVQNISWFEVFDFEPGDEIHYEALDVFMGEGSIHHVLLTYLARQDYLPDSIVYEVEVERWSYEGSNLWTANLTYDSTTVETHTIRANPGFDRLPYTPFINEGELGVSGHFLLLGDYHGFPAKFRPTGGDRFEFFSDLPEPCFFEMVDWACWGGGNSYYAKGLGAYSYCDNGAGQNNVSLKYFNKAGVEWGNPLSTEEFDRSTRTALRVFPNPARDRFRLEVSETHYPLTLRMYSPDGRLITRQVLHQPAMEADIPAGFRGMLILSATTTTGGQMHGKVVAE